MIVQHDDAARAAFAGAAAGAVAGAVPFAFMPQIMRWFMWFAGALGALFG